MSLRRGDASALRACRASLRRGDSSSARASRVNIRWEDGKIARAGEVSLKRGDLCSGECVISGNSLWRWERLRGFTKSGVSNCYLHVVENEHYCRVMCTNGWPVILSVTHTHYHKSIILHSAYGIKIRRAIW